MQPPPPNDSLGTHFSICKLTAEPGKDGFWCFPETSCRVSDDIGVPLKRLLLLSERNISSFVPRLSVNKGMLPVRLKLTGTDDLPGSAAIQVSSSFWTAYKQADANQNQWELQKGVLLEPALVVSTPTLPS
jgi:hypothetical protein